MKVGMKEKRTKLSSTKLSDRRQILADVLHIFPISITAYWSWAISI